jgi:ATP-dependent DNA helicase DinG
MPAAESRMSDVYVSLDLEMTSARPENQEVIEIAAIKFRGDRVLETWSRLIRPKGSVPYNVQILTGIKPADLARAPTLEDVAAMLVEFVGRCPLVAQSISSDVGCLRHQGVALENPQIDTFELASVLLPQLPAYGLAAIAEHFRIPFPTQHRAAADAFVTKSVFLRLVQLIRELDLNVLQEINRLVAPFDWPLKEIFGQVEAARPQPNAFGSSIRQQLAAKSEGDDLPLEVLLLASSAEAPLLPAERLGPLNPAEAAGALAADGVVGRGLAGFEPRPAQVAMSQAVAESLASGEHLLVEAPVGTGRTFAYLIPAVQVAVRQGEPVVVAASSSQILDQLWDKDLPTLRRVGPTPFRAALLKPRASYLCFRRWSTLRHQVGLTLAEALTLVKTLVWLPRTRTGDVAELNLSDAEREIWAKTSADEECEPETCDYSRRGLCFLGRALDRAATAHIVLTSQALLLADLVASRPLLPDYRYLVVDEAHRLEEEGTLALARHFTSRALLAHLDELADRPGLPRQLEMRLPDPPAPAGRRAVGLSPARRRELETLAADAAARASAAREAATPFLDALAPVFRDGTTDHRGFEQRIRITKAIRGRPAWARVVSLSTRLIEALGEVGEALASLLTTADTAPLREGQAFVGELRASLAFLVRTADVLAEAAERPDAARVYWLSLGAEGDAGIHSAPVRLGEALAGDLFAPRESAVLTSSTLAVGPSFDFVRRRLGLNEAREVILQPSPGAVEGRMLYLPTDMPEPELPAYQDRFTHALAELCLATGGRTLVLFNSHSQLRQTWKAIQERLAKADILVLGQGIDGSPRRQLVLTFRTNARTVLLATGAFWEHLDVAGSPFQVLVIPRIPFAHVGDPVIAARSEGLRDPLAELTLPQAIIRLRQGLDRLASARPSRGAVVVFDRRLQTKSYGPEVLGALAAGQVLTGPTADLAGCVTDWVGIKARLTSNRG